MQVLIEKIDTGYRASFLNGLNLSVEGETESETLDLLQVALAKRLNGQSKVIEVNLPDTEIAERPVRTVGESPAWQQLNGLLQNDPYFDEWMEIIQENRRQRDKEEGL